MRKDIETDGRYAKIQFTNDLRKTPKEEILLLIVFTAMLKEI